MLCGCGPVATPSAHAEVKEPASPPDAGSGNGAGPIRLAGLIRAVRVSSILSPQVAIISQGGSNRLTLVTIVANGARVNKDDVLAEFDTTRQQEETLEVEAKADDLGHQVLQKAAQNLSEAEKRLSDIKQAEADLNKALITRNLLLTDGVAAVWAALPLLFPKQVLVCRQPPDVRILPDFHHLAHFDTSILAQVALL